MAWPVAGLSYETGGVLDAAKLEEGGGVDLAAGAEPLYPTGGGGVDLGEGLPRCPW